MAVEIEGNLSHAVLKSVADAIDDSGNSSAVAQLADGRRVFVNVVHEEGE